MGNYHHHQNPSAFQAGINKPQAKIIPMRQLRWSVAIAAVLLLLNVMAIRSYAVNKNDGLVSAEGAGSHQLVSDYKIYE